MLKMDVRMLVRRLDGSFGSRKKPIILYTMRSDGISINLRVVEPQVDSAFEFPI